MFSRPSLYRVLSVAAPAIDTPGRTAETKTVETIDRDRQALEATSDLLPPGTTGAPAPPRGLDAGHRPLRR